MKFTRKAKHLLKKFIKKDSGRRLIEIAGVKIPLYINNPHEKQYYLEPRENVDYKVASSLIADGDEVLDCGANVGMTALYYLECGAKSVDAIEPVVGLANRIEALGADCITVHKVAVGDEVGTGKIMLSSSHNQGNSLNPRWKDLFPAVFVDHDVQEVEITTLDELFAQKKFNFIKIDIEGLEDKAIKGGENLLQRCKDSIVQIELYPEQFMASFNCLKNYYDSISRVATLKGDITYLSPNDKIFQLKDTNYNINPPNYIFYNRHHKMHNTLNGISCEDINI